MGAEQLSYRLLCTEANVDSQKGRKGLWNADDWKKVSHATAKLHEAPIWIDDTAGITPMELRAKCRQLKQREKIGLVIVDYLQLMDPGVKKESREREVSHISQQLKALAKELNIPVIALSQLNRQLEARADKRPTLSDLRESGSIENDADLVLFIYRPETYGKEQWEDNRPSANTAEIIIAKQRNGPIGNARVAFFSQTGRFENYTYLPEFRDMDKPQF